MFGARKSVRRRPAAGGGVTPARNPAPAVFPPYITRRDVAALRKSCVHYTQQLLCHCSLRPFSGGGGGVAGYDQLSVVICVFRSQGITLVGRRRGGDRHRIRGRLETILMGGHTEGGMGRRSIFYLATVPEMYNESRRGGAKSSIEKNVLFFFFVCENINIWFLYVFFFFNFARLVGWFNNLIYKSYTCTNDNNNNSSINVGKIYNTFEPVACTRFSKGWDRRDDGRWGTVTSTRKHSLAPLVGNLTVVIIILL